MSAGGAGETPRRTSSAAPGPVVGAGPEGDAVPVDEVDRILAGWHRSRPGLDVAPLAVFSRVGRIARMLDLARRRALAAHGIETWEFDVLTALRRAERPGEPPAEPHDPAAAATSTDVGAEDDGTGNAARTGLSAGELMAESLVSSGTMTNRLRRLEEHGLVTRAPDPADRRVVRVHLTRAGRRRVDAALDHLLRDEDRLLGALSPTDRAELAALLRRVLAPLEGARR